MEQILAFVLGVSIVPFIWGVMVVFKTSRNLKSVQHELPNIYEIINSIEETLNRRIDQEIDRVNEIHAESNKYIDSRVDKLDSRFESKFNDVFTYDESKRVEVHELRQRINNAVELINDIAGLNIKK